MPGENFDLYTDRLIPFSYHHILIPSYHHIIISSYHHITISNHHIILSPYHHTIISSYPKSKRHFSKNFDKRPGIWSDLLYNRPKSRDVRQNSAKSGGSLFRTVFVRFWAVSDRFRVISNRFGPFFLRFGPFRTVFFCVSDRFGSFRIDFGSFRIDFGSLAVRPDIKTVGYKNRNPPLQTNRLEIVLLL